MIKEQIYTCRFWSRVEKGDDCWLFTGSKTHNGYGNFYGVIDGETHWRAHRYSWALENGPIPKGKLVMHSCDTPACVNPNHLSLGTHTENAHDRGRKGRSAIGSQNGATKLTENQVRSIRSSNKPVAELAREYGMHHKAIWRIVNNETWRHLL